MVVLKHRPQIKLPDLSGLDPKNRAAIIQVMQFLFDNFKNIYDDLNALENAIPSTGSWRIVEVGDNYVVQHLENDVWVEKAEWSP